MAVDRINKSGGVNGRPIELLVADYESKPDVGRRKAEKLVVEDQVDAHAGGYLSNVCLACMPVYEEHKVVNMITVCLDTTITQSKCSRFTFRPFDFAPSQAVAAAPYMVGKIGKRWHIAYADYAWGQSTKDAYVAEIRKNGGEVVGTTGIPLGTADMTSFLSKITGSFDGLFGIFFGPQGIAFVTQSFDLGLTKKYRLAGDGAIAVATALPAIGSKGEGFVGIDRYVPVMEGVMNTPHHKRFFDDAVARLKQIDPSGPLPDRYVQSNYEGVNALKIGMQKSGFQRPPGHDEADRGPGRARDEGRGRLPPGRQAPPQGGPPGVPAAVPVRAPRGQVQGRGRHPQGKDGRPARLPVRVTRPA